MKLPRTKQCAKCPWKVDCDPDSIPGGYSRERHQSLEKTIADPDDTYSQVAFASPELHIMACHESPPGEEMPCLGWLMNQLGPGNNIGLRLAMRECENIGEVELVGAQHETFEETLPRDEIAPAMTDREQYFADLCQRHGRSNVVFQSTRRVEDDTFYKLWMGQSDPEKTTPEGSNS